MAGALYVSNPPTSRDRKGRFKKGHRASNPPKTKAKKTAARRTRNAPPAQQAMFAPPAKVRRTAKGRRKGTRSRTTRRAGTTARPRISRGWKYAKNARGKGGRFTGRRRRGGKRARNALSISNPMGGVPFVGTAMGLIGPAFFGGIGIEIIAQVLGLARRWVTIPESVESFQFTFGGLLIAGFVEFLRFIPAPIRRSIQLALASGGTAVDWFRYRHGSGAYGALELGDGGEWEVETMSDTEAFGALEMGALDLSGDEDHFPLDFSVAEGEALADGYGTFLKRFPIRKHPRARNPAMRPHARTPASEIHDPRREGDRCHWFVQLVGHEDARKVANMPPEQRLQMIQKCKEAAKAVVNNPGTFARPPMRQLTERMPTEIPIGQPGRVESYAPFSATAW